ncbi:MAG TPA: glycosyltransferase family 4 protein [Stenomitos sp.]
MKILHLSANDLMGGAARSAFRLHQSLQALGHESLLLAQKRQSRDPSVLGPETMFEKVMAQARPHLDRLPMRTYQVSDPFLFSTHVVGWSLERAVRRTNPAIAHLHWISSGFMAIEALAALRRPLVWTLHDMWAFTGGCHYDQGCGRYQERCGSCPILASSREADLSRRNWERKARAWRDLDLTIVTPSRWLGSCAESSSLFRGLRVEVIPYGLDLDRFKRIDKAVARQLLGLPQDRLLVLFGAMGTDVPRKGFAHFQAAVRSLVQAGCGGRTELVVMGGAKPTRAQDLALPVHDLGVLHDDIALALAYAAADVFVAPSTQENLANTVLEALACGTPTAAFRIGGMPDMIDHQVTGWLAEPFHSEELAAGLAWLLEDPERLRRLGQQAREKAEREFEMKTNARRYARLYQELSRTAQLGPGAASISG